MGLDTTDARDLLAKIREQHEKLNARKTALPNDYDVKNRYFTIKSDIVYAGYLRVFFQEVPKLDGTEPYKFYVDGYCVKYTEDDSAKVLHLWNDEGMAVLRLLSVYNVHVEEIVNA